VARGVQRWEDEAMNGHGQFCPVAMASEVFAHRWTPLILRELFAGSTHFNELKRGLPLISKTTLTQRLRALEDAGVLTSTSASGQTHTEYRLTPAGAEFQPVIQGLGAWGQRWTARFDPDNLDAEFLMWNVRRRLAVDQLPEKRTLVRFDFFGLPPKYRRARNFWLIIDRPEADLCLKDPGAEVDLYVSADLASFSRVWLGDTSISAAIEAGQIRLSGLRDLVGRFPSWLLLSKFAGVPRPPSLIAD
jgi:DNA-binding HxlR family transcriptional regulator